MPVLEASRVRIEPIGPGRALALVSGCPEPGLAWAQGFPPAPLLRILRRVIAEPDGPVRFGPFFAYVVIRRGDGLAIGDIGFHGPPGPEGDVEVGFALVPAARGAGLATESVVLMVRWACAHSGVRTVSARVEPGNSASIRLLERLGFERDGLSGDYLRYAVPADMGSGLSSSPSWR